jgi:threonine/homoserine/homoserine lactone efflux protein
LDWTVWMMFALTEDALTLTPGPAVLFVASQGLRSGSSGALLSAAGILAANALYFAVSGTGVGALLAASGYLFTVVEWAGASYLLYLGAVALLRPQHRLELAGARKVRGPIAGRFFFPVTTGCGEVLRTS